MFKINNLSSFEVSSDMIVEKVKGSSSCGSYNLFIPLNDKIALKLNRNKKCRDGNYARQEQAAEFGLGPDVYGILDVEYNGEIMYGYLTEIVHTLQSCKTEEETEKFWELYHNKSMFKEIKKYLPWFSDDHEGNFGVKNGELIVIDFDLMGQENTQINKVVENLESELMTTIKII